MTLTFLANCAVVGHFIILEPKRSLKTKLLAIHQKNINGVLDRSGKAPTKKKRGKGKGEKEGKNEETWEGTKPKNYEAEKKITI